MNCLVCGKEFGVWARLTGDAADEICKSCEEEAQARLDGLIGTVSKSIPSGPAMQWVTRFNELSVKYHLSEERGAEPLLALLEAITRWIERREKLEQQDVVVLGQFVEKYKLLDRGSEETARTTRAIWARWNIQEWEAGAAPRAECSGLLLEDDEVCHWQQAARLLEQRTRREYVGASQGISVRLARGVSYRVGAFKGAPIDTTYLSDAGAGTLHITSSRICFTGSSAAAAIPFKKIISVSGHEDGLSVFRTGAKKPTIFQVEHPELTLRLLALATPAKND
ncbi:MAG: hypothetical protein M1453_07940 [Acidobacteria bacterium]|nr:hypothetical protein [Acidobacteriota bacterium]